MICYGCCHYWLKLGRVTKVFMQTNERHFDSSLPMDIYGHANKGVSGIKHFC